MRRVIFNADDLGISPGVDRAIARSVAAGLVREVSVCVTSGRTREALETLRATGREVGIGLHLSLTFGSALTGRLRGLTDAAGKFLPLPLVLTSSLLRVPSFEELEREVSSQLELLLDQGCELSHINGHHHVHVFPIVRSAVLSAMRRYGLDYVRVPIEGVSTGRAWSSRRALLGALSRGFLREAEQCLPKFRRLPLVGLDLTGALDHTPAFLRTAERLESPASEWLVHPREPDESFEQNARALGARTSSLGEVETLTDRRVIERLAELGIAPCSYGELAASGLC